MDSIISKISEIESFYTEGIGTGNLSSLIKKDALGNIYILNEKLNRISLVKYDSDGNKLFQKNVYQDDIVPNLTKNYTHGAGGVTVYGRTGASALEVTSDGSRSDFIF